MATQVQSLRSSVPLARPPVGAQAPGVLYVNWPDKQIGVIDASQSALDLLAIRFYSDFTVYQPGDLVVQNGGIWRALELTGPEAFDPGKWIEIGGGPFIGIAPPSPAVDGMFWYNPNNGQLYIYYTDVDSAQWVSVSGFSQGAGGAATTVTPPDAPLEGQIWFNPNNGQLYVWYADADSEQWVSVTGLNPATIVKFLETITTLEARIAELEATSGGISIS